MTERVQRFMEQWSMVRRGDTVVAGVSGGADSVCLLLVLAELAERMGFSLSAAHIEHGIRGAESERDADFAARLCERLGILLTVRRVDVPGYAAAQGLGLEEAARILRYGAFAEIAQSAGAPCRIALAHQLEDNAETVLMALVRGTGLDGLCGMPPLRTEGGICYIRPLLATGRAEIEAFLAGRGQDYCTDSTNLETKYTRNYIRREVFPLLERVNPQAAAHMSRTAAQLAELRVYVERETAEAAARVISRGEAGEIILDTEALGALPEALAKRVVHRAIGEAAGARKDFGAVHIEAVLGLLARQSGRRLELPSRMTAERVYGKIVLRAADKSSKAAEFSELAVTGEQLRTLRAQGGVLVVPLGGTRGYLKLRTFDFCGKMEEISTKNYTKCFNYGMIEDGFSVRSRKSGDFLVIDAEGHRKKLSDYFVDEKIPAAQRDGVLLLASGAEVLWVIGGRMGFGGRVTERTKTVLEVTYRGEEYHGLQEEA